MYISSPARLVFAQTSLCVLLAPKVPSAKTHKILLISPKMKSKIQRMVLLGLKLSDISCVFSQTLYSSGEDVFPLHMSFVFCVCGILSLYTLYRILKFLKFLASLLKSSAHPGGALSLHLNRADTEHFLPDKTAAIPEQTYEGKGKRLQKQFQMITHDP